MAGNRRSIRTWRIRPPTAHSKPAADCEVIGRANPTLVRVADKLNTVVAVSRFRPVLDGLLPMTGATEQLALQGLLGQLIPCSRHAGTHGEALGSRIEGVRVGSGSGA